jgi:hypothetical protein
MHFVVYLLLSRAKVKVKVRAMFSASVMRQICRALVPNALTEKCNKLLNVVAVRNNVSFV